jgi:hypothetical protein
MREFLPPDFYLRIFQPVPKEGMSSKNGGEHGLVNNINFA